LNYTWVFTPRWQWHCNRTQHTRMSLSHNARTKHSTQTIQDTLRTMNTTQRSKAIPVAGRGYVLKITIAGPSRCASPSCHCFPCREHPQTPFQTHETARCGTISGKMPKCSPLILGNVQTFNGRRLQVFDTSKRFTSATGDWFRGSANAPDSLFLPRLWGKLALQWNSFFT
jgi:hypothetical protein